MNNMVQELSLALYDKLQLRWKPNVRMWCSQAISQMEGEGFVTLAGTKKLYFSFRMVSAIDGNVVLKSPGNRREVAAMKCTCKHKAFFVLDVVSQISRWEDHGLETLADGQQCNFTVQSGDSNVMLGICH